MGTRHGYAAGRPAALHAHHDLRDVPLPASHRRAARRHRRRRKRLDELREGWLNPAGASPEELEQRTLTKLYNAMPSWLRDSHTTLDHAVLTAYGWPQDMTDDDLLGHLLDLNLLRSAVTASPATS